MCLYDTILFDLSVLDLLIDFRQLEDQGHSRVVMQKAISAFVRIERVEQVRE